MLFSIVIPSCNNRAEMLRCLQSLAALSLRDFEVWLCLDGSTDGSREAAEAQRWNFPLQILTHPGNANRGRSATRNLALPHLTGEYVLFLDSDMEAPANLLESHLEVLRKGKTISIGRVNYLNEAQNFWARYTGARGVAKFPHGAEVPHPYFIVPDTAMPTAWFRQSGGFDERIAGYGGEDMELGYRLWRDLSPRFIFNERAAVSTVQHKSLDTALAQLREYGATGLRYIVQLHPELKSVYWIWRAEAPGFKNSMLRLLCKPFFVSVGKFLAKTLPFALKKPFINYLVIAHIHNGYHSRTK